MCPPSRQVLVADDDPDVLKAVCFGLKRKGYTPVGASSLDLAKSVLKSSIVHAAIIDIQLGDESSGHDETGFQLAKHIKQEYPDIPYIVFTAYPSSERLKRTLTEDIGAKDFLAKGDKGGPDEMYRSVERLFRDHVRVNFDLDISGSVEPGIVAEQLARNLNGVTAQDVVEILRRTFFEAKSVQLDRLGKVALHPTEAGSIVLQAQAVSKNGMRQVPIIVKFNEAAEIRTEAENIRLLTPHLGGKRVPVFVNEAYSRHVGGLTCSLIGMDDWDTIDTFSEFFQNTQIETARIIYALERFWGQTFGNIHTYASTQEINLTDHYTTGLHLTSDKVKLAASEIVPDPLADNTLSLVGLDHPLFNPFRWALPDGKFRLLMSETRVCACHGDLHCNNILVDSNHFFWLIDFARADKQGHILRDFVELEADIKFRLLPAVSLPIFDRFERALSTPSIFTVPNAQTFNDPMLDRGYEVISSLRRIAAKQSHLPAENLVFEYFSALFLQTLKILALKTIPIEQKRCAVLSASLLAENLAHIRGMI